MLTIPFMFTAADALAQEQKTDTARKEQQIKEVVITQKKDAIETAPGKTIVNVQEMSGNAGKNILDVLRRMPGVSVDAQGNISLAGKNGVLIQVNGRPTYLGGEELRDYLRGMTAEEVAQVELVTQPSAKYDAEGNAGIINLKLRKGRRAGLNGSLTVAGCRSLLESTHNSVLLNYRKGSANWFANINYVAGRNTVQWDQRSQIMDNMGNVTTRTSLHAAPVEFFDKPTIRTGADLNLSQHTTAGFSLMGAYYANQMHSPISFDVVDAAGSVTENVRNTYEHSLRRNASANGYLKHTFADKGELEVNLDYLLFTKRLYQYLNTATTNNDIPVANPLIIRSRIPTKIAIHTASADYNRALGKADKLETGAKYIYVIVDNAGYFMQYANNTWSDDASRTNHFLYNEHISAAYANVTHKFSAKWDGQVGLRGENAVLRGLQTATGQRLERHLPSLFPTAYLRFVPDSSNSLELNYGRRVERPQYAQLNPFNYYTFYGAYQRGNPGLLPQYTHNMELSHRYKSRLSTSLQLSMVTNSLNYAAFLDSASKIAYGMPVNFKTDRLANLAVNYHFQPREWWEVTASVTGRYALFNGLFNGASVQKEGYGYMSWLYSNAKFGKWEADCYLSYNSPMVGSPFSTSVGVFYSNIGMSRKVLHDKGVLKLSVDDPFFLYRGGDTYAQPGYYSDNRLISNSRYVTLTFTYSFGGRAAMRERETKAPVEAGRAQ